MDNWQQHVQFEIQDATFDKGRLLDITNALIDMEGKDLIPEQIASTLFSMITYHNEGEDL